MSSSLVTAFSLLYTASPICPLQVCVFVCVCARARAETTEEAAERLDSAMKVCLGFWI